MVSSSHTHTLSLSNRHPASITTNQPGPSFADEATPTHHSTNTGSPYCAVATALSSTVTGNFNGNVQKHFACESSPYNLNFIVSATYQVPCVGAPPFIANPTSLVALSIVNPSYAHSFGDPFRQLVARSSTKTTATPSITLSTTGGSNKLSFPTTTSPKTTTPTPGSSSPKTSPITTTPVAGSGGAEMLVVPPHRMITCGLAVVLALIP